LAFDQKMFVPKTNKTLSKTDLKISFRSSYFDNPNIAEHLERELISFEEKKV